MKSSTLMFVTLLALSLNGVASAAKFEKVKSVRSTSLSNVLSTWKRVSKGQEDTGSSAARIVEKKESEAWLNTVKQFQHSEGATYVDAVSVRLSRLNARKELRKLVEENFMAANFKNSDDEQDLVDALEGVNGNKLVFVGNLGGDAFSYNFITFVDVTRNEMITIYAGISD